jgi:hypothetical protein
MKDNIGCGYVVLVFIIVVLVLLIDKAIFDSGLPLWLKIVLLR